MTKDVLLSITGLQFSPDQESNSVEVISPGEYYYRNGRHFFLYDEVTEGFDQVTKNIVKVSPDYMELTKKGVVNVHMVFEKNQKNVTYYYTPFGSLLMGIDAKKIDVQEAEEELREVLTTEEYAEVFGSGRFVMRLKFLDYFRKKR
jgi:uncharacterized beta-barrel protein YwiB (DUF1934 family)